MTRTRDIRRHPDSQAARRFEAGVREAGKFFMGASDVHLALKELVDRLTEMGIPHAIVGAMALNAHGYQRATSDVDVLLRREDLDRFKATWLGRGYVERIPGGRGLRDTRHGVDIDVLLSGEYPGDGRAKPIAFPDPGAAAVAGERFALLPLETLIELKLASGMTAPHRLRDLADVIELVRRNELPESLADTLHPYVRSAYLDAWRAAQFNDPT